MVTAVGCGVEIEPAQPDHTARLWDVATRATVAVLRHDDEILSTCFSHRGDRVLTASLDHTAKLWDRSGNFLRVLPHRHPVYCAGFSPDDRLVVCGTEGRAVLWRVDENGREEAPIELPHASFVMCAAFAPDGTRVLTADVDGTVHLWDLDGRQLRTLRGHTASLMHACFSPDGELVATASWDGTARLWRAEDPVLPVGAGPVQGSRACLDVAPNGAVVTGGFGGEVYLSEPGGGEPRRLRQVPLSGLAARIGDAAFDRSGRLIATAAHDHRVTVWDRARAEPVDAFDVAGNRVDLTSEDRSFRNCRVAWLPDRRLLVGTQRGEVLVRDIEARTTTRIVRLPDEWHELLDLAVHPDGDSFAVAMWDGVVAWPASTASCESRSPCSASA